MPTALLPLRRFGRVLLAGALVAAMFATPSLVGRADAATSSFSIALSQGTVSVPANTAQHVTLRVTRARGFTTNVALRATQPAGLSIRFAPARVRNSTQVIITTAATAAPGTYRSTITGTARGRSRTAVLSIVVPAPPTTTTTPPPTTTAPPPTTTATTLAPTTIATTTTTSPAVDFTLTATPATVGVAGGGSGQTRINIVRTGGFADALAFSVLGLPDGAAASFQPDLTTANSTTLTLFAGTAAQGTYNITVKSRERTVVVLMTIAGNFSIVPGASTLAVAIGASSTLPIFVPRGGYVDPIALSAEGLPVGLTAAFNPQTVAADSSTMTIAAAANAVPGSYVVNVVGVGGPVRRSAPVTVIVGAVAAAPVVSLSATPLAQVVAAGGSATFGLAVTSAPGIVLTGPASYTVSGLAAGATATFNPIDAITGTSAVVATTSATPSGTYPLTFRVTIGGVNASAAGFVTVGAAGSGAAFDLVPAQFVGGAARGTTAVFPIGVIQAGGATNLITFVATGLPAGVTATFPTNPSNTGTTLQIAISAAAAPGTYPFNLSAASGTVGRTLPLTLVIV